ncbi:hypothetical protein SLS62_005058 [Diatrype stigma]|uniref:Uncharacterized protein n=1 Tax=Diatrype stigma TaxID=117547 RepID=A0AAN9YSR6_9PEZI
MASSPQDNTPPIDIQLSFDRSTHAYSQPEPPTIAMAVTSRAQHSITVFTWSRPLDPTGAFPDPRSIVAHGREKDEHGSERKVRQYERGRS